MAVAAASELHPKIKFYPIEEQCLRVELSELPPEQAANVDFIGAETRGLYDDEDATILCEGVAPGSAIDGLALDK